MVRYNEFFNLESDARKFVNERSDNPALTVSQPHWDGSRWVVQITLWNMD